jgi:hypothetical protein
MIKSLRKRHLQIWTLWAVLLPIGIITAWLAVPKRVIDKLLQPGTSTALPVLLKSIDKKNYTVNLKSNENYSQYQLEWLNKETLTVPSFLIYKASPNPSKGGALEESELIGRIEAKGTYNFPLKGGSKDYYSFVLYDIIRKQIIDSLKFSAIGGG